MKLPSVAVVLYLHPTIDKFRAAAVHNIPECLHRHLLITAIGGHIIRMVPPLIITEEDCDKAYDIIKASVEALG